ncbi:MAG TPA: phosphotransferase family protein [Solirubrobacterales bacterium]|nr:phosphotransferase family protein [Solirubrobacterales bacterium]
MNPAPEPLVEYLDREGLGTGELIIEPIGDGHSNLTYLLRRGEDRMVLRRPPHGRLAPSANDIVREARVLDALRATDVRVPEIFAICEEQDVIGAPFYLMSFIAGHVLIDRLPPGFGAAAPDRIGTELIEMLVALHAIDVERAGLSSFGRPSGYLERQVRRFRGLLEHNATRPLPELEQVGDWLADNCPESADVCLVHGDYRLGNMIFAPDEPRLAAVLDWEMSTIGDPLADLGYCTAAWAQEGDPDNPVRDLSRVTRSPGFPDRDELARRYAEATDRSLDLLPWYQVLALWKAAIFLEGSYGRFLAGASTDRYFARLDKGVPLLAQEALRWLQKAESGKQTERRSNGRSSKR